MCLQREELTEVILRLLVAWGDPLSNLHDIMAHWQDFNTYSGSKALEMSDMVHQLRTGVQRVAERVRSLLYIYAGVCITGEPYRIVHILFRSASEIIHLKSLNCFFVG